MLELLLFNFLCDTYGDQKNQVLVTQKDANSDRFIRLTNGKAIPTTWNLC